jgi:hypothetical protein
MDDKFNDRGSVGEEDKEEEDDKNKCDKCGALHDPCDLDALPDGTVLCELCWPQDCFYCRSCYKFCTFYEPGSWVCDECGNCYCGECETCEECNVTK